MSYPGSPPRFKKHKMDVDSPEPGDFSFDMCIGDGMHGTPCEERQEAKRQQKLINRKEITRNRPNSLFNAPTGAPPVNFDDWLSQIPENENKPPDRAPFDFKKIHFDTDQQKSYGPMEEVSSELPIIPDTFSAVDIPNSEVATNVPPNSPMMFGKGRKRGQNIRGKHKKYSTKLKKKTRKLKKAKKAKKAKKTKKTKKAKKTKKTKKMKKSKKAGMNWPFKRKPVQAEPDMSDEEVDDILDQYGFNEPSSKAPVPSKQIDYSNMTREEKDKIFRQMNREHEGTLRRGY
jgi:hypothetical protein